MAEQNEIEPEEKENISYSGNKLAQEHDENLPEEPKMRLASFKEVRKIYGVIDEPKEHRIVIDKEKGLYIILYLKEITVNQQLSLMEQFIAHDEINDTMKMDYKAYYKRCYEIVVVDSSPTLTWKKVKQFGPEFSKIIHKLLPNPFKSEMFAEQSKN